MAFIPHLFRLSRREAVHKGVGYALATGALITVGGLGLGGETVTAEQALHDGDGPCPSCRRFNGCKLPSAVASRAGSEFL